jgi:hypothetical protein
MQQTAKTKRGSNCHYWLNKTGWRPTANTKQVQKTSASKLTRFHRPIYVYASLQSEAQKSKGDWFRLQTWKSQDVPQTPADFPPDLSLRKLGLIEHMFWSVWRVPTVEHRDSCSLGLISTCYWHLTLINVHALTAERVPWQQQNCEVSGFNSPSNLLNFTSVFHVVGKQKVKISWKILTIANF